MFEDAEGAAAGVATALAQLSDAVDTLCAADLTRLCRGDLLELLRGWRPSGVGYRSSITP